MAPGNGLERGRNGGSGIRAAIALPALLGKLGKGSGIALGAGNAFPKTPAKLQRPDLAPPGTRTLNIMDIGRHLVEDDIDPPLRALFIYNHNPIVVHPDQNRMRRGLCRARTSSRRHRGGDDRKHGALRHRAAGGDAFRMRRPLCRLWPSLAAAGRSRSSRRVGESLPNTEIFRRLAARFGFDEPCFKASDAELMDDAVDGADPRLRGMRPSEISTDKALRMTAADGKPMVLFDNVFPATPSGKIELISETLAEPLGRRGALPEWRPRRSAYPLTLISPASDKRISSTLLAPAAAAKAPPLMMHPDDARGARPETAARCGCGTISARSILPLEITDEVPPGVVASEKGAWLADQPRPDRRSRRSSRPTTAPISPKAPASTTPASRSRRPNPDERLDHWDRDIRDTARTLHLRHFKSYDFQLFSQRLFLAINRFARFPHGFKKMSISPD